MVDPEKERRRKTRLFWAGVYALPLVPAVTIPLAVGAVYSRSLVPVSEGLHFQLGMLLAVGSLVGMIGLVPLLVLIGGGCLLLGAFEKSHRTTMRGASVLVTAGTLAASIYWFWNLVP